MANLTRSEFLTLTDLEALTRARDFVDFGDMAILGSMRNSARSEVAADLRSLQDRHGLTDYNHHTGYSTHASAAAVLAAGMPAKVDAYEISRRPTKRGAVRYYRVNSRRNSMTGLQTWKRMTKTQAQLDLASGAAVLFEGELNV